MDIKSLEAGPPNDDKALAILIVGDGYCGANTTVFQFRTLREKLVPALDFSQNNSSVEEADPWRFGIVQGRRLDCFACLAATSNRVVAFQC
ncbi:MAG TPA: hypothetical protein DDW52_06460 [Planctomycetaceae bacterium]|nr:hypothetical protein [Planctomycetaceae bacterium]